MTQVGRKQVNLTMKAHSHKSLSELLNPGVMGELKRLELRTRRSLDADLMGQYRSAFRGSGLVYSDLREYQPGDEIKNIHWKATARTQKVYVKSYEEERELNIMLIIDVSNSTMFGATKDKHSKAFEFAALLALLAQSNHDALGLCLFSEKVDEFLPCARSRSQVREILYHLLAHRTLGKASNLDLALTHVQLHQKRRSIVFVISDFLCPAFEKSLEKLTIRHDVVCVLLDDPLDAALPNAGLVEFSDLETGERYLIDTTSARCRRFLTEYYKRRMQTLATVCNKTQSDLIIVRDKPLAPLAELMKRRTARSFRSTSVPSYAT